MHANFVRYLDIVCGRQFLVNTAIDLTYSEHNPQARSLPFNMPKRLLDCFLICTLLCISHAATADALPPEIATAAARLHDNPKAFDRIDTFCNGKRVGDACSIPGDTFAGGGEGVCSNAINRQTSTIDLSCVRTGRVSIDRKLPDGGFVHDRILCSGNGQTGNAATSDTPRWNCKPLVPTPADQFCKGKTVGAACTVKLVYESEALGDKHEQYEGVCKHIVQTESVYFRGRHTATREVVQCEPVNETTHTYTPATWWQKLTQ